MSGGLSKKALKTSETLICSYSSGISNNIKAMKLNFFDQGDMGKNVLSRQIRDTISINSYSVSLKTLGEPIDAHNLLLFISNLFLIR